MTRQEKNREFAADVVRRLQQAGFQALWAGGCVRDLLMGRAPQDYCRVMKGEGRREKGR